MKNTWWTGGVMLCLGMGLGLLGTLPQQAAGTPKEVVAHPKNRIVALTALSADILQRLKANKIVGISGSRLLASHSTLAALPRVSEGRSQPNLEKILSLKPDVVIGATGFHEQTASRLQQSGIATLLLGVDSWADLEEATVTLGKIAGTNPQPLLQQYQSLKMTKPPKSQTVLVLVSRQPILTPNSNSWAGGLLRRFHLVNAAASLQGKAPVEGYVTLSAEKILQINPEVLIVVDTGEGALKAFQSEPYWQNLKAVRSGRVHLFDYYGLVNPGSIDAIVKASQGLKKIALTP